MPRSRKPRKPYRKPEHLPEPLVIKQEREQREAYAKTAGRMGNGHMINPVARKMARHIGIQDGGNK